VRNLLAFLYIPLTGSSFICGLLHFLGSEDEMFQLWIKASIAYETLCNEGIISVHQEYITVIY
jgi:hypothetical protein